MPEEPTSPTGHPELKPPSPANPEPAAAPEKLFAGKYRTSEELEKAYLASANEVTTRLMPRLQQTEHEARILKELLIQGGGQPANQKSPFDELEAIGLPKDTLERAIDAKVQQFFGPIERAIRAQQELVVELPDFQRAAPEIQRFLADNPALQQEFNEINQVNPKAATKYVFREYQASQGPITPRQSAAEVGGGMPSSQTGQRDASINYDEALKQASDYYKETGDDKPFTKLWFEAQRAAKGGTATPTHASQ